MAWFPLQQAPRPAGDPPSATFSELTFSDNTTVRLGPRDVVVFVGPNNAGKSAALRELQSQLAHPQPLQVTVGAGVRRTGTLQDVVAWIGSRAKAKKDQDGHTHYTGYKISFYDFQLNRAWEQDSLGAVATFFVEHMSTATRITDANPAENIDFVSDTATKPLHVMYDDDEVAEKIADYFKRAYGKDLAIDKGAGKTIPLLVGTVPDLQPNETPVSTSFVRRLRDSANPLADQGDGMRSFATILLGLVANKVSSLVLLDEPEAFLHPPQSRLVGEIIAKESRTDRQTFVATHSADILQGLLASNAENLRLVRIQREGATNVVKELDSGLVREIARDPLMRYSSILSGVFHRKVIVAESDSDCLFYNSVLQIPAVRGEIVPDVLFVHGSGKHRMAQMASTLRALGVPTAVIADLDLLNEEDAMRRVVEAQGGDWQLLRQDWVAVRNAIEEQKPFLDAVEIKKAISQVLEAAPDRGEFPGADRRKIEGLFRKASPWDAVKDTGIRNIPAGQPTQHFDHLNANLKKIGIWLVPVGQLEGFCRKVGGHGPSWVQEVISTRNLETDPDLDEARAFIKEIWAA